MRPLLAFVLFGLVACGGPDLYNACDEASDCDVPEGYDAECLDKSGQGFCSWECDTDADCSDSPDDYSYVCAPFESEPGMHCFPSCDGDGDSAGACPNGYGCRSTGGGSDNRKICFPEG